MQNVGEMYEKYSKIIYKYIFCLTGDKELSEEIVQEAFLVAVKNIDSFKGKSKLSTWICGIAKNICYKKMKKDSNLKKISLEEINDITIFDGIPEELICEKERKIETIKKLQMLDEETKNVMYLRIYAELSYEEIAEVMGKSASWARVVFFRGKQKMKGLLE